MPRDLKTTAGREELRREIDACHGRGGLGLWTLNADLLTLLDLADAGEREWRPICPNVSGVFVWNSGNTGDDVCYLHEVREGPCYPISRINGHIHPAGNLGGLWFGPLPPPPARAAAEET